MTEERIIEIMQSEDIQTKFPDECNVFAGLKIVCKYLPKRGICGCGHEVVYSADISELAETEITEDEVKKLREMNWMYDEDCECLACFV